MNASVKGNKMSITISSKEGAVINPASLPVRNKSNTGGVWSSDGIDFDFTSPPEAPVFRPSLEEFSKGPLHYVNQIKPFAEPYGICKIIPPASFQPPFAVDVEKFRFTPRVQRLNELEAQTRVKLNFLEQIIKYWDLQGATLKIPTVEKKLLDLHALHKSVEEEGGFESCTRDRKWSRVAMRMGFNRTIASLLRQHYERILYPYDVFLSGATIGPDFGDSKSECSDDKLESTQTVSPKEETVKEENESDTCKSEEMCKSEHESEEVQGRQLRNISRRYSRRTQSDVSSSNSSKGNLRSKELKKLQVYGAGPKMPGFSADEDSEDNVSSACVQCGEDQLPHQLLKCAGCGQLYHLFCLIPPLNDIPKGVWNCPRCVAHLVQSQPQPFTHEFGFVQSQREYTLSEFGEMADEFKRNYFQMPPHAVPLAVVEKEFWRLVTSIEDTVTVEYGADLHTNDFGSGFPTKNSPNLIPSDYEYLEHAWNLNNLPVVEGSVFKYINANISGMIIPWMYVGMCFSTFCWHNEDHWSYSINYLHWGEAKSWYGVPGNHADTFENAMKQAVPELFESQPDLLHQLVTICNPNLLMQYGVPIYRTNQQAGEFVVTFPRAYHAGFNQGLNFAEAVNFAPADWLDIGRNCMSHYSMLHRYPVFSHDELVCKMASNPDIIDISIAAATYDDMKKMVDTEKRLRLKLLEWGVTSTQRVTFELLPDDERQCEFCRTTCFLSALTCTCSEERLVCICHMDSLCKTCKPTSYTLRFRYTLDELPIMVRKMQQRMIDYDKWVENVKSCFELKGDDKVYLCDLKALADEAAKKKFPLNSDVYLNLKSNIEEVEKASKAAKELLDQQAKMDEVLNMKKVKQEFQETISSARLKKKAEKEREEATTSAKFKPSKSSQKIEKEVNEKLTLEELSMFYDEIEGYPCRIPESTAIKDMFDRCIAVSKRIIKVLRCCSGEDTDGEISSKYMEKVINDAESIAIVSFGKQLEKLKGKLDEIRWLEECESILEVEDSNEKRTLIDVNVIKNLISVGMTLTFTSDTVRSTLVNLQKMVDDANKWLEKSKLLLCTSDLSNEIDEEHVDHVKGRNPLRAFEALLEEVDANSNLKRIDLNSNYQKISDVVKQGNAWTSKVNEIFEMQKSKSNASEEDPLLDTLEKLVNEGSKIGCQLDNMPHLTSTLTAVNAWKERLFKTFCRKNSIYSLLNILMPRSSQSFPSSFNVNNYSARILHHQLKKLASQSKDARKTSWFEKQLCGDWSKANIAAVYQTAVENEMNLLKNIRKVNLEKNSQLAALDINFTKTDDENIEDVTIDPQTKKFCFCGKSVADWMIQCQVCQDWYHLSCVQSYISLLTSTGKGRRQQQTQPKEQSFLEKYNFICTLCCRGRRPQKETVKYLLSSLHKIPARVFEGELLHCLLQRATAYQEKVKKELFSRQDLLKGYEKVLNSFSSNKSQALKMKSSTSSCINIHSEQASPAPLSPTYHTLSKDIVSASPAEESLQSPSKNKRKSPLVLRGELSDEPLIELSEESRSVLYDLLWEGNLLEVSLDDVLYLWNIWLLTSPLLKAAVFIDPASSSSLTSMSSSFATQNHKRKLLLEENAIPQSVEDAVVSAKKRRTETINNKKKEKVVPKEKVDKRKGRRTKGDKESGKSGETDLCSMGDRCLKPNGAEVDWVFCEGPCQGWFHQLCAGIQSPEEIVHLEKYYCIICRNAENEKVLYEEEQHETI